MGPRTPRRGTSPAPAAAMDGEYNTNVSNKDERKRVRQRRVEARNASEDNAAGQGRGKEAQEESKRSKGQQQIANSLAHLDKKKSGGIENVTHVRVAADWREAQRRVAEEKQRQDRLQRLQEEAVRSGKQNAAVEMRWAELLDQNMPQELHNEIEAQKSACSEIIASKDALIREFQRGAHRAAVEHDPAPDVLGRRHSPRAAP